MIYKSLAIKLKSESPSEYKIGDKVFDPIIGCGVIHNITKTDIVVDYENRYNDGLYGIYELNGLYFENDNYNRLFKIDDYDINFEILEK